VAEKTLNAMIDERVTLSCTTKLPTPVDWYYQPSANAGGELIWSAGSFYNGYSSRYAVNRNVPGDFSLVITNVTQDDAGVFSCKEDVSYGPVHRTTLNVHGKTRYQNLCNYFASK